MRNLTQRYMPVPAAPCTMQSACFLLLLVLHILRKLLASPVALLPRSPGNRLILCSHSSDIAAPPPSLPPGEDARFCMASLESCSLFAEL